MTMRMMMITMMMMMMMSVCVGGQVGARLLAPPRGFSRENNKNIQKRDGTNKKHAETYEENYTGKTFANDIKDEAGNYMDHEI